MGQAYAARHAAPMTQVTTSTPPSAEAVQASSNIAAMPVDAAGSNRDQPSGPSRSIGRKRALYAIRADPSIQ